MTPTHPPHLPRKKIAIIIGDSFYGGIEVLLSNLLCRGHFHAEIHVLFHEGGDFLHKDLLQAKGMHFACIPKYTSPQYCKTLLRLFKREKYDAVHAHLNTMSFFPLLCALLAKVPIRIAHNHATAHWAEGTRTLLKYLLRPLTKLVANRYCACGQKAALWMYGQRAVRQKKVHIFRNAIPTKDFAFSPSLRQQKRQELNISEETFVLGHVGRFMQQKNHPFLLEIFTHILKKRPDAQLLLIGEGPLYLEIKELAAELRIAENIHFLDTRRDVSALYSAMDAFVLPSLYEGFPLVGIEAQSNGLPCFFADTIDAEILLQTNTHILSIEGNPAKWAQHILQSTRTQDPINEEYDLDKQALTLQTYYDKL